MTVNKVDSLYVEEAMDYQQYKALIDGLLKEGKTTGTIYSGPEILEYAKLNATRMSRLEKTVILTPAMQESLSRLTAHQTWLVLTEGWCGDAAQSVPIFNAIANATDKITLRLLLRDENPDLMQQYLYEGKSKSIPRLIAVNDEMEELFVWGPRPATLQGLFVEMQEKKIPYAQVAEMLHTWYAKDRTISVQSELAALLRS